MSKCVYEGKGCSGGTIKGNWRENGVKGKREGRSNEREMI